MNCMQFGYVYIVANALNPAEPAATDNNTNTAVQGTVCPRGLDPFYVTSYDINWVKISWKESVAITYNL